MTNLELAKNCSLFKDLELQHFHALLHCLSIKIKEYKAGDIIEREGNKAKYAYLILKGTCKTTYFDINGYAIQGNIYQKDEIYGIEYFNQNENTYQEEFIAIEDSTIMIMNLFTLLTPCENRCPRHYHVINKCLSEFTRLMTKSKKRIHELSQTKMRDKILTYLKNNVAKDNNYHKIPYNRQELAEYLGVERTALSSQLSKLKKEGIIDYKKSEFMWK